MREKQSATRDQVTGPATKEKQVKEEVEKALDLIRPALMNDGGNVELVDVDEATGIVKVKLVGACGSCPCRR